MTFDLAIPLYRQHLTVHRCPFAELLRWAERLHPKRQVLTEDDAGAGALSLFLGGKHVLWIDSKRMSAADVRENIVHEVVHISARVLEQTGMRLTRDTEEAYAYLQAYLYATIATRLGVA